MIEEPVTKKVYAHLGRTYIREPEKDLPAWQLRDAGGRSRAAAPTKVHHLSRTEAPRRFASRDLSVGLGDERSDSADAWAYEEWKVYGFSAVERDAWIDGGLRRGQAKTARDLRDAGLAPTDLNQEVLGWSVAKRLRSGEPAHEVVRLLDQARANDKAS